MSHAYTGSLDADAAQRRTLAATPPAAPDTAPGATVSEAAPDVVPVPAPTENERFDAIYAEELAKAQAAMAAAMATPFSIAPDSAPEPALHDHHAAEREAGRVADLEKHHREFVAALATLDGLSDPLGELLSDANVHPGEKSRMETAVHELRRSRVAFSPAVLTSKASDLAREIVGVHARAVGQAALRRNERRNELASMQAKAVAELNARFRYDLGTFDSALLVAEAHAAGVMLSVDEGGRVVVLAGNVDVLPQLWFDRVRLTEQAVAQVVKPRRVVA